MISLGVSSSPRKNQPAKTAKTDSKLKIKEAMTGGTYFCPTTCNVQAIPQDSTPAYKMGIFPAKIKDHWGDSKRKAQIKMKSPQKKNCTKESLTPSKSKV